MGADPQATVAWFKSALSELPIKIDQYSTSAERSQHAQLAAERFNNLGLLPFKLDCSKEYNPDAQSFSFSIHAFSFPHLTELHDSKLSKLVQLVIFQENKSLGTYIASNAYGVTRTVKKESEEDIYWLSEGWRQRTAIDSGQAILFLKRL